MTSRELIDRYNAAWNAHDVDAIVALHTSDMVFENHTAGESAAGDEVRDHVAGIFDTWPDLAFQTRRLHTGPGHAVCAWTATATRSRPMRRGELVAQPTGRRVSWRGVDVFTIHARPVPPVSRPWRRPPATGGRSWSVRSQDGRDEAR